MSEKDYYSYDDDQNANVLAQSPNLWFCLAVVHIISHLWWDILSMKCYKITMNIKINLTVDLLLS